MILATQNIHDTIDKRKDSAKGKRGRPLAEEVKLYNFSKKPKEARYLQGAN